MRRTLLSALVLALVPVVATAQQQGNGPSPPAAAGSEVGNWGLIPFLLAPSIVLDEEGRKALRALEDRHLAELRALEDRYAKELLELRARHAAERTELVARGGR